MRLAGSLYAIVYVFMALVIFILPAFSFEGYSLIENSLNELGAQASPANWLMNAAFMLLAMATAILATKSLRRYWLPLYTLYFFALSLFFTGVYNHAPVSTEMLLWEREHITHAVFSILSGTCFLLFCLIVAIRLKKTKERVSAILMFVLAVGLSLLMFNVPEYRGVFQRVLFLAAFAWLFYALVSFNFDTTTNPQLDEK